MTTLARRAIASRHWQWLPGCLLTYGDHINPDAPRKQYRVLGGDLSAHVLSGDPLPVTDDAATVGCLLALARLAWRDPRASTRFKGPDMQALFAPFRGEGPLARQWQISLYDCANDRHVTFGGFSEAEALVAALEAAP